MRMLETTNVASGRVRYYIDGKRVNRDTFDAAKSFRWLSCLQWRFGAKHRRFYCEVN